MTPLGGGAPTGSFWGQIAQGSVEPAERLAADLARRSRRRSATQKTAAGQLRDELVAMGEAAVPALVERLDALGEAGCETLARIGPAAVPALVDALQDGPRRRRCLAARALELMGSVAAVVPLRDAALERDPVVRETAGRALDGLARTLVRRLRDGHRRDEAMSALATIGERAVWPLAHVLHDRFIGLLAARVLSQIGEPAVPAALLVFAQARRSPDCEDWDPAAANATTALAAIGAPALPSLLRLLEDRDEHPNVRAGVVHVLARMGDLGMPHVVTALGDSEAQVRDAAAAALARVAS